MKFLRNTKTHSEYWKTREIDWDKDYLSTWDHPHRTLLAQLLSRLTWVSLFEVGCGSGPNIKNFLAHFKNKQLGGVDISPEAIELAQKSFNGGFFKVGSAENIPMSDKSVDVVLTDMTLIYVSDINKAISEMKRVSRSFVVLCELHSTSWWKRLILKWNSGYYARNYKRLLEKHGFYDIGLVKIPKEVWDGKPQIPYGYIILARTPKR